MQDKEFDQLFRNTLKEAEMEPSKDLWKGIEARLEPRKKAPLPIFWMAAVLTLMVMSGGLLLTKKVEKIQLQGKEVLVENMVEPQSGQIEAMASGPSTEQTGSVGTPLIIAPSIDVDYKTVPASSSKSKKGNELRSMQPIEPSARLPITSPTHSDQANGKVDGETVPMIANAPTSATETDAAIYDDSSAEKKGIRNVGDLVNFVVDKVDKREQKILKFNTDEDDNSSLVAINIGFIKFNSKKHR